MKKIFSTIVLICALQFSMKAQDTLNLFELDLEQLMNITVYSSNKKAESIIETPAVINVITSEEIKILNFNSLEQILEYSTGLASINGEGNIFTTTTVRGNTLVNYNTNTLLLFDGIPIFNAYHGSFDFQSIPISSIERIEIVKGSNSVLYGSNAMNGVINIISKKASKDEKNIAGKVKYGSFNTMNFSNSIVKKSNDWQFYLFTEATTSQGEKLPFFDEQGNTIELENMYKGVSAISIISYKDLSISFQYSSRNLLNVKTRKFEKIYTSITDTEGIVVPENNDEYTFIANIAYTKKISDKININFRSNLMNWELQKILFDGHWDYSSQGIYNDLDLTLQSSEKFSNKLGISYNHYLGRRYQSQTDSYDIGANKIYTDDISFFLNGEYQIFKPLKIFYGGRYYTAKYDETVLTNFSPRLALTFNPVENLYFKAIYGKSFRIPTYFEKEVASATVIGNPNLLPEKSTSYDFVISSIINGLQFDIDVFYTEIRDRILRMPIPNEPTKQTNLNTGKISLKGIEFNSKFKINDYAFGFIGYAFTKGKDITTNTALSYVFENMLNFGGNIKLNSYLNFNTSVKYLHNWGKADSYTLVNMGLNLNPSKNTPILFEFKIDNILNKEIYLPEIARNSNTVPIIPKTLGRIFYTGISYNF